MILLPSWSSTSSFQLSPPNPKKDAHTLVLIPKANTRPTVLNALNSQRLLLLTSLSPLIFIKGCPFSDRQSYWLESVIGKRLGDIPGQRPLWGYMLDDRSWPVADIRLAVLETPETNQSRCHRKRPGFPGLFIRHRACLTRPEPGSLGACR